MFPKRSVRLTAFLALVCAMLLVGMAYGRPPQSAGMQDLVRVTARHRGTLDEVYTQLRYVKTTDMGASWSGVQTAGDLTAISHTRGQLPDFCTVTTNDNNLCYVVYLDTTNTSTPGLYSFTGPSFTPVLVMAAGANDLAHTGGAGSDGWASVGKTPNGDLFAVAWGRDASNHNTFWAIKSTNSGTSWGTPFVVYAEPSMTHRGAYPHVAQMNSATNVFIIYQDTTATGFNIYAGKFPVGGGLATFQLLGPSTEPSRSFYVGACQPIGYDPTNNALYCVFVTTAAAGAWAVYNSGDQANTFTSSGFTGSVRYPSVSLRAADQSPFIISNYGVPAVGSYHKAWSNFDQLGYGGGNWSVPTTVDSALDAYDGVRPLLYINEMYWWDANNGVVSNNIWGALTPEAMSTERTTDGGATWVDYGVRWSSLTDTIDASTTDMCQMAGGTGGVAYVTFGFSYGHTDRTAPEVTAQNLLTPYTSTGPYTVSADITEDQSGISPSRCTVNWDWNPADNGTYVFQPADSAHVTDPNTGSGTYFFTIPDTASNGHHWASGDTIWFYCDATDNNGNYGYFPYSQAIVVGSAYLGVNDHPHADVSSFALVGNYPNPFNPSTQITFDLPAMYRVNVKVYNMLGQQVSTVVAGQLYQQGRHSVTFDGSRLASGIYFYTLSAGPYFATQKMVLLK